MVKAVRSKKERKSEYFDKFIKTVGIFSKVLLVQADNVRSSQLAQVRRSLRGRAEILMGKNTHVRKILKSVLDDYPQYEKLIPFIRGNIGFVFTNESLSSIRDILVENKLPAPARAGAIAQCHVVVPAGSTGMPPEKTSFFQALNIATKINRGLVEIVSDVHLLSTGDKVNASQAELLNKMNIFPFSYGLVVSYVFEDGQVYPSSVLDITNDELIKKFMTGISSVASVSLAIGYPTVASVPHSLINGYKNIISVALATDIKFEAVEKIRAILANPTAFASSAAVSSEASTQKEEKPEEKEESSDIDLCGGGLFDGDEDDF